MKKSIAKTAALVMAAMIAVPTAAAVCAPATVYAVSDSAEDSDSAMKAALTVAKKRITVPEELSEFTYSTDEVYGTTIYRFAWYTPNDADEYKRLNVSVMGDLVVYYEINSIHYDSAPRLAKLTEEQLLEKAKGYAKQLDPDIYSKMSFELKSLSLTSDTASVSFERYENGVPVPSNSGEIRLDKNTGELISFSCDWWENAEFKDPKGAKSEEEIKTAYKSLCGLTPYYKISSEYDEKTQDYKKVVRIVYVPDMTKEIDAYTATPSTIWDDMDAADGTRYYGYYDVVNPATGITEDEATDAGAEDDDIDFTEAELEKIEQDNNLIKTEEFTERFNTDPYIALNGNYKLYSSNIYSEKDEKDKEIFYMSLTYKFDKTKTADNYYETISVRVNAETGDILEINKWGLTSGDGLPKLDVTSANAVAESTAKKLSKDIISQYKADEKNKRAVESWESKINGKTVTNYETSRSFAFNRYVNDIQVSGDNIYVDVDSLGTVVSYDVIHTENVTFPSADILTADEAFEKLYKQRDFNYYYDGWMDKDGKVHTYLLYKMDSFYLNAKTGALCNWLGSKLYSYTDPRDVSYTDIKGIPQEEAILALQKYGIAVTTEKKFDPTAVITEEEFTELLSDALRSEVPAVDEVIYEGETDAEAKARIEAEKKDKAETTREEAAVIFAKMYDPNGLGELKGIYRSPFSDVKSTDENVGYIAIAYAKGFISKPSDGLFNGGKAITRAEAVQMLYDYLKLISK